MDMKEMSIYNWWGFDLSKPSHLKKLIKKIERIVRISPEYKIWADSCRSGYSNCPKCNISSQIDPLEVHHSTKTLYELIEDLIDDYLKKDEEYFVKNISPIDIVKEILIMHLENKVDYEVLCSSCHERLHNERKIKEKIKSY